MISMIQDINLIKRKKLSQHMEKDSKTSTLINSTCAIRLYLGDRTKAEFILCLVIFFELD